MKANELIRLPELKMEVRAEVREVLRDVKGRPHVFARIKLSGWYFPERAPEPFMVVGELVSRRVEISRDGQIAKAYFDEPLPSADRVSFGYGKVINWDFDVSINPEKIERLDRVRLPKGVIDPFRSGEDEQDPTGVVPA
jgi:hypothetical protein